MANFFNNLIHHANSQDSLVCRKIHYHQLHKQGYHSQLCCCGNPSTLNFALTCQMCTLKTRQPHQRNQTHVWSLALPPFHHLIFSHVAMSRYSTFASSWLCNMQEITMSKQQIALENVEDVFQTAGTDAWLSLYYWLVTETDWACNVAPLIKTIPSVSKQWSLLDK